MFKLNKHKTWLVIGLSLLAIVGWLSQFMGEVKAATPTAPSYELLFAPKTGSGSDATGDGGGGTDPYRFHEYYVGQSFSMTIVLHAGSAKVNGGDARIDIENDYLSCTLDPSVAALEGELAMKTFTNPADAPGLATNHTRYWIVNVAKNNSEHVTGTVNFARLNCTVLKMREAMGGTTNPLAISWYLNGTPFHPEDTNIADFDTSADILVDAEDAEIYLWPDTNKPYATGETPTNGSSNVVVNTTPRFYFKDRNNLYGTAGETNETKWVSGDETGINTSTLTATYTKLPTLAWQTPTSVGWGSCQGTWNNRNSCQGTITPKLIGSTRYFSYGTAYRFCVANGQDIASNNQPPAVAGPNVMDQYCFDFTTEADVDGPDVINNAPTGNAVNVNTNISFQVRDIKSGTSIHGVGVDPSSLRVRIEGYKEGNAPFDVTVSCSDTGVTCTPVGSVLEDGHYYAYNVVIDPSNFGGGENFDAFAQDMEVTVTVNQGVDWLGNLMTPKTWKFKTQDTTPPTLENFWPATNSAFCASSTSGEITFEIIDSGVGVRKEDLVVRIMDSLYQFGGENSGRLTFTGDANHWYVTIDPLIDLQAITTPFAVIVNVKDQSNNIYTPEELYALVSDCNQCSQGCGADGICNAECKNDPDCPAEGPRCSADGVCDPLCVYDPDCPGGTNCPFCPSPSPMPSPTPTPIVSPAPTNCPTQSCPDKCEGKHNSCSSCCPQVSCPSYPETTEIVYRYRNVCVDGEVVDNSENMVDEQRESVLTSDLYGYGLGVLEERDKEKGNVTCQSDCWRTNDWLPWLLVVILTGTTLHQAYRKREFRRALEENDTFGDLKQKNNKKK